MPVIVITVVIMIIMIVIPAAMMVTFNDAAAEAECEGGKAKAYNKTRQHKILPLGVDVIVPAGLR